MTLYDILGIPCASGSPKISQQEIRAAFRSVSRLHHPDKGGDEEKYKQIVAAYAILNNPETKSEYDKIISNNAIDKSGRLPPSSAQSAKRNGGKQNHGPDGPESFVFTNQDFKETMMELGLQFVKILDTCAQDFFEKQKCDKSSSTKVKPKSTSPSSKPGANANANASANASSSKSNAANTDSKTITTIAISIADLYNCRTKQLKLTGREICRGCNGVGGKGKEIACPYCKGQMKYCEWCDMRGFFFEEPCIICHGQQLTMSSPSELLLRLSPSIEIGKLIEIHTRHFILPVCLTVDASNAQSVQHAQSAQAAKTSLPTSHAYTFVPHPNLIDSAKAKDNSDDSDNSNIVGGLQRANNESLSAPWFLSPSPLSKTDATTNPEHATSSVVDSLRSCLWCTVNIPVEETTTKNINYLHKHLDGESYWFVYKDVLPPGQILCAAQLGMMGKDGVRGNLFIQFVHHWPLAQQHYQGCQGQQHYQGQQGQQQQHQQMEKESEQSQQQSLQSLSKNFYPEVNQRAKFGLAFHPNTVVNLQPVNRVQ